jgi:lipoprotein-anchoring transpeptidase ErfK/SrfK
VKVALLAVSAAASVALGLLGASLYTSHQEALAATQQAEQQQRAEAAAQAWVQFMQLTSVDPGAGFMTGSSELARARTPADFIRLRDRWRIDTETARLDLDYLAQTSGGLEGTMPHDLAELGRSLNSAAQDAAGLGISTAPAPELASALATYSELPAYERVAEHDQLKENLGAGVQSLTNRVTARREIGDLVSRLDDLVSVGRTVGIPDDLSHKITDAKAQASAAKSDQEVLAAAENLRSVTASLNGIITRTDGSALPPCLTGAQNNHLIWIHLQTQQLVAYQDGCPWLATQVTTGRPELPTGRGTFSIFYKSFNYTMVSPWSPATGLYYPPTVVHYAMEFINDGTFMHTADWQPDDTYGPGSQYGPYASHGCVHVRDSVIPKLYAWAPIGTTVIVSD